MSLSKSLSSRAALVETLRARLQRESFPRAITMLMLMAAGLLAFAVSALGLRAGVESMAVRYGLATLAGYLTFVALIRVWIAVRRGVFPEPDPDLVDLAVQGALDVPASIGESPGNVLFTGGHSGGGGGGAGWDFASASSAPSSPVDPGGIDLSLDLDELWWLVLAAICALGGLIAIAYVVYAAPLLLAEVALDAALVTTVARRLRKQDVGHWTGAVLRHTAVPAVALIVFMSVVGFALQRAVPEARSVGGVARALMS